MITIVIIYQFPSFAICIFRQFQAFVVVLRRLRQVSTLVIMASGVGRKGLGRIFSG